MYRFHDQQHKKGDLILSSLELVGEDGGGGMANS